MIRLALLGPSWPLRGGIARTTTALAETLAARGRLVAFLAPRRQYPRVLYPGAHDLDLAACPLLEQAERCFGVLEPWTWPRVVRRLRAAHPDALVIPYWTWAWAPFGLFVLRAGIAPTVLVVHNPADHDASRLARRFAHAVLSRASGFFCHAAAVRDTLASRWAETPAAVHPIPPGEVRQLNK